MQITKLVNLVHRRLSVATVTAMATVHVRFPEASEWVGAQDPEVVSGVAAGVAYVVSKTVELGARWLDRNRDGKVTIREVAETVDDLRDRYLDGEV